MAHRACKGNRRPEKSIPRSNRPTSLPRAGVLAFALCGFDVLAVRAAALPACFPPVEIKQAKIVRVERNGVLVLEDGRAAKLEGILFPAGGGDRAPETYATEAIARLEAIATGRTAILAAQPPKEDRYGRLRAEVLVAGDPQAAWLQRALLEEGLARVDVAPDRSECVSELYAAEAHARAARAGIWSAAAYAVRTPSAVGAVDGTFQIVEGKVARVTGGGGRMFLEFGPDRNKDFAVVISVEDIRTFRAIGVDPYSYENQTVRVRGWITRMRRPEMEVATPADIEVVRSPPLRGSIIAPE
ncbi:MAG TPA: thermonuclease family protein [Rhizomicrobium sp.]